MSAVEFGPMSPMADFATIDARTHVGRARSVAAARAMPRSKRALDICAASAILLVGLPMFLLVALAVRLTSRGPVLFKQQRLGRNGVPFAVLKFRTMRRNAEALVAPGAELHDLYVEHGYKLPARLDRRLTPPGRLLRKLSLDELPQVINVLRGHMTMVGVRPIIPVEVERFGVHADELLSLPPGLTGLWQVEGRSDVVGDRRLEMDLTYVRTRTFFGDLRILAYTVEAVFGCRGAC